jgi:hypothetical protein
LRASARLHSPNLSRAADGARTLWQVPITFELGGLEVRGDARVSVFALDELLEAREKRSQQGLPARLEFDGAPVGPWDAGGGCGGCSCRAAAELGLADVSPSVEAASPRGSHGAAEGSHTPPGGAEAKPAKPRPLTSWKTVGRILAGHAVDRSATKRVIAGKEVGCKFYFLFHTGCVGPSGTLDVPLHMMDKACKNKNGKYHPDGLARLEYDAPSYDGLQIVQPATEQSCQARVGKAGDQMA